MLERLCEPGPRLSIPLLQSEALTQTLAVPPLTVIVVVDSETVTPPTVAEPPGLMVVPPEGQFPSIPGATARAWPGKSTQPVRSNIPAIRVVRPALASRLPRDQLAFDQSPELIAVFHALLRLLAPRHPPHALSSLTALTRPSSHPSERQGRGVGVCCYRPGVHPPESNDPLAASQASCRVLSELLSDSEGSAPPPPDVVV
jgi:hypothetical protein